jgi:hypothetical protein
MPPSILAHQQQKLSYDADAGEFVFDEAGTWVVQSLDYFEAQRIFAISDAIESVRVTLELALVAVPDGTVADFLKCPAAQLVQPLYAAVWKHTKGN